MPLGLQLPPASLSEGVCDVRGPQTHTAAFLILLVWGVGGNGESEKGDERTGPALNPLKGSSARVPRVLAGATHEPFLTFVFSAEWKLSSL